MKRKLYLALSVLLVILSAAYFVYRSSPTQVVAHTIDHAMAQDMDAIKLPAHNIQNIESFLLFAEEHNLNTPHVSIQEAARTSEQSQVVVFFEMIEYSGENQVKKPHTGSLIFTLEKTNWFNWYITDVLQTTPAVKSLNPPSLPQAVLGSSYPTISIE